MSSAHSSRGCSTPLEISPDYEQVPRNAGASPILALYVLPHSIYLKCRLNSSSMWLHDRIEHHFWSLFDFILSIIPYCINGLFEACKAHGKSGQLFLRLAGPASIRMMGLFRNIFFLHQLCLPHFQTPHNEKRVTETTLYDSLFLAKH
jgi:hypothetical protein